jgi:hypothetical protein
MSSEDSEEDVAPPPGLSDGSLGGSEEEKVGRPTGLHEESLLGGAANDMQHYYAARAAAVASGYPNHHQHMLAQQLHHPHYLRDPLLSFVDPRLAFLQHQSMGRFHPGASAVNPGHSLSVGYPPSQIMSFHHPHPALGSLPVSGSIPNMEPSSFLSTLARQPLSHTGSVAAAYAQPLMSSAATTTTTAVPSRDRRNAKESINEEIKDVPLPADYKPPPLTGRDPVCLALDMDEKTLSPYQCELRKHIELFETKAEDAKSGVQGRNTPIQAGQVGLRCRHCSHIPKGKGRLRKGTVYYSRTLEGLYQVAQNLSKVHLCKSCPNIPEDIKNKLAAMQLVNKRASGGKEYWVYGLNQLGVYEDHGVLRFRPTGWEPPDDES